MPIEVEAELPSTTAMPTAVEAKPCTTVVPIAVPIEVEPCTTVMPIAAPIEVEVGVGVGVGVAVDVRGMVKAGGDEGAMDRALPLPGSGMEACPTDM